MLNYNLEDVHINSTQKQKHTLLIKCDDAIPYHLSNINSISLISFGYRHAMISYEKYFVFIFLITFPELTVNRFIEFVDGCLCLRCCSFPLVHHYLSVSEGVQAISKDGKLIQCVQTISLHSLAIFIMEVCVK